MKNQKINEKASGLTKKQRSWIYTGFFVGVILLLFVVNNTGSEPEQGPYPPNYVPANQTKTVMAYNFTLPTSDGKQLKLSDYKGKVVIIDFWATWCPPCRKGIPDLVELKKKYGSKGVEIIGVSVDQETKPDVVPFIKEYGINYPIVYGNTSVYQQYGGIRAIPTSFIIDKEGKVVASYEGLISKAAYEDHIKKLL
jgi:cytochrome c biogenesis protein CcmG/thiol:disulfide interchange protein DsbE